MYQNKSKKLVDRDLLENFFEEMVVLEACLYGLCSIIQEYDKEKSNEMGLAAYIQLSRVKEIVYQLNKSD